MGAYVDTCSKVWLGSLDLTPLCSGYSFGPLTAEAQNFTTFGDCGFTANRPGLLSGNWSAEVFQDLDVGKLDDRLRLDFRSFQGPFTVLPDDHAPAAGDLAWFGRGNLLSRQLGGRVGSPAMAPMQGRYDAPFARGVLLAPPVTRSSTGTGTAVAVAAPTASQRLLVGIHVFELSGITGLTVKVQSDDSPGMSSATDRFTSASFSTHGAAWASVPGGWGAETHIRATWTVTGSGSFTAAIVAAVL